MPVCPNCGNQAAETAVFCDQCGTKLPATQATLPTTPSGEALAGGVPEGIVICPECGAENVPGEVFCDACGEPLEAPEPAAVEAIAEAEPGPVVEAETVVEAEVVTEMTPVDEPEGAEAVLDEMVVETIVETIDGEILEEATPEAEGLFCPACGAAIHADDTFCGNCGASLGEPEPEVLQEAPIVETAVVEEEVVEPIVEQEPVEIIVDDLASSAPSIEPMPDTGLPVEPTVTEVPAAAEPLAEETITEAVVQDTVIQETAEEPDDDELRCTVCGATVLPEQAFCASCGATLQPPQEAEPTPSSPVEPLVSSVSTGPHLTMAASGGQIPLVDQPELLIGRVDDVSGIYPDIDMAPHGGEQGGISRRHARLLHEGDEWAIMDLDSTNGTFVNEIELEPKVRTGLSDGDKISLGDIEIVFHTG